MRRAGGVALVAFALLAGRPRARAQDEISVSAATAQDTGADHYVVGDCGRLERGFGHLVDESISGGIGHAFRGLGSPGQDFVGDIATTMTTARGASGETFAFRMSFDAVLVGLGSGVLDRLCLTTGADFVPLGGSSDSARHLTGGHLGGRIGFLARTRSDDVRLRLEVGVVVPSFDHGSVVSDERPVLMQGGYSAALASGIIDEILALAPLDWGVRGIGRVQFHWAEPEHRERGAWLDVRVSLGYAQLATRFGPRGGLVGGVELLLLAGGTIAHVTWRNGSTGEGAGIGGGTLRVGGRAAVGFGSLWPSDFVLPMEAGGVIEYGWAEGGLYRTRTTGTLHAVGVPVATSLLALDVGATFLRLPFELPDVLGPEYYFRMGFRYAISFPAN